MIDLGTVGRKFKNERIKIGFYNAPITNLSGFKYGKQKCELCSQERKFFTRNPNPNPSIDWLCIECLKTIKIEVTHSTKLGYVSLNLPKSLDKKSAKNHVTKGSFEEMLKTPSFLTLQGEEWLCHCKDFMDYIGTWDAPDFTRESEDGNGKKLFKEMTKSYQNLWDDFELTDNETANTWIDCLYHVFECRHCKIKQGYWEL